MSSKYEHLLDTYEFEDLLYMNDLTEEDVLKILDELGHLNLTEIPEPL